ncbi:hypothetical protein Acr_00g0077160 [Actinidia rufa]|uniref:Uncharacterized protein n=1 Tax=Actinidia rufa TaxID=165716 RepID=A0A7J0DTI5_9ERIC|nr:hypothetical protein Acr_00g0077160 [Actinidia rufa]
MNLQESGTAARAGVRVHIINHLAEIGRRKVMWTRIEKGTTVTESETELMIQRAGREGTVRRVEAGRGMITIETVTEIGTGIGGEG